VRAFASLPRPAFALAVLAGLLAGSAASAQDTTRSPTGRHRPPPAPEVRRAAAPEAPGGRWFVTLGAGALDGGDLLRVETLDGLPVTWSAANGGGFRTERFKATLDPGPAVALGLGCRLGRRLSVRGDVAWTKADVAAEAALGAVGAVYTFDRFGVLSAGLSLEARLVQGAGFYPYLSLGASLVHLAPDAAKDLTQTRLGGRAAFGFGQRLDDMVALRLEAFAARTGFSVGSWRPVAETAVQPDIALSSASGLTVAGLLLLVTVNLGS